MPPLLFRIKYQYEAKLVNVIGCEKDSDSFQVYINEKRRAHITNKFNLECTMFDFADFNRQHTLQAQVMIFDTLVDLGEQKNFAPDWVEATRRIAASKFNMRVSIPSVSHRKLKVVQGMFSGTRSTDFINTILNLANFQIAYDEVEQ